MKNTKPLSTVMSQGLVASYLKEHGLNSSLATIIFSSTRECTGITRRMREFLGLAFEESDLSFARVEAKWPFFTEEESTQAVFHRLLSEAFEKQPWSLLTEAHLKNYKLSAHLLPAAPTAGEHKRSVVKAGFKGKTARDSKVESRMTARPTAKSDRWLVVQAEVQRSGDLMSDQASRQTLFRAVSHEIRTSVMALRGFLGIIKDTNTNDALKPVLDRMDPTLRRLEKVVDRLEDFKTELKVLEDKKK
jgi:K+-sensing histidine kinase KdpD